MHNTHTPWTADDWAAAWRFAARAHRGQAEPSEQLPYLLHLGQVAAELLAALPHEPPINESLALQCALLHDTLEDTGATREALVAAFGEAVAAGVEALTKDGALPKNERMADSLRRIQAQPREVWMVKLADRITNLQPPPPHWSVSKALAYADEAEEILAALGGASEALAGRLRGRIAAYRALVSGSHKMNHQPKKC